MTDDRSTEELERDAARIRDGIASTTEELKHRMSPGQMADEVSRYLRDSDSSVAVENLRRQARDNPMALALIGAGVAWLMLGGRRDRASETYEGYYGDVAHGEVHGGFSAETPRSGSRSGGNGSYADRAREAAERARETAREYGDRARGATHEYGDRARGAAHEYGDRAREASGRASDAGEGVGDRLRSAAHDVRDRAAELGQTASEKLRGVGGSASSRLHGASDEGRRWAGEASERGRHWAEESRHYAERGRGTLSALEREPLVTGAIGLAIGAILAALLPRTRIEDETYAEGREQMRRGANRAFDYAAERAQDAAGHVYEAGREAAEREGLTSGDGSDKPIAERVGAVAKAAADAARGEARTEAERGREAASEATDKAAETARAKADEGAERAKSAADRAASSAHAATEEARSGAHAAAEGAKSGGSGGSGASSSGASRDAGGAIPGAGTVKPKTGTDDLASRAASQKRDVGPGGTGPS